VVKHRRIVETGGRFQPSPYSDRSAKTISQCITVVMTLFVRATGLINKKKLGFSDPQSTKTPEPMDFKFDMSDYIGDITHMQNLEPLSLRGTGLHMHAVVDPRVYFLTIVTFFTFSHSCTARTV